VNFETKGEVISGATTDDGETNAEFSNVSGDIETQAFVISLYDKELATEKVEKKTEERPNNTTNSNQNTTSNQQTNSRNVTVSNNDQQSNENTTEEEETPTVRRVSSASVSEETPTQNQTGQNTENVQVLSSESVVTEGDVYVDTTPRDNRGGGNLTKTSDHTSYVPIIVIGVLGVGVVIAAVIIRRRK